MDIKYNNFQSFKNLEEKTFVSTKGVRFIWDDTGINPDDNKVYVKLFHLNTEEYHFLSIDELDGLTLLIGETLID